METDMDTPKEGKGSYWSIVLQTLTDYNKYKTSNLAKHVNDLCKHVGEYIVVDHPKEMRDETENKKPWQGVDHLHIGLKSTFDYHITKNYQYQKLNTYCKQNFAPHRQPNTQKMRNPNGWLKYIQKEPRKIQYITPHFEEKLKEAENYIGLTENKKETETKENKSAMQLQFLIHIIKEHNIKQAGEIMQVYNNNKLSKKETALLFSIFASANYNTLIQKALALEQQRTQTMTFDELLTEYTEKNHDNENKYETIEESIKTFERLAIHNNWDKEEFLTDLRSVLNKTHTKKNTFVLQGEPNSGKSLLIRSLIPITRFYGEVKTGNTYNFVWQDCIDKNLIIFEEPCLAEESILEEAKLIFEGAETMVHKKNNSDLLLKRTPVLITTNSSLTKYFPSAREAFKVRCINYKTKQAQFLKKIKKPLNPLMWKKLFDDSDQLNDSFENIIKTIDFDILDHNASLPSPSRCCTPKRTIQQVDTAERGGWAPRKFQCLRRRIYPDNGEGQTEQRGDEGERHLLHLRQSPKIDGEGMEIPTIHSDQQEQQLPDLDVLSPGQEWKEMDSDHTAVLHEGREENVRRNVNDQPGMSRGDPSDEEGGNNESGDSEERIQMKQVTDSLREFDNYIEETQDEDTIINVDDYIYKIRKTLSDLKKYQYNFTYEDDNIEFPVEWSWGNIKKMTLNKVFQEIARERCIACKYNNFAIQYGCNSGQVKCCMCNEMEMDHDEERKCKYNKMTMDRFGLRHRIVPNHDRDINENFDVPYLF